MRSKAWLESDDDGLLKLHREISTFVKELTRDKSTGLDAKKSKAVHAQGT